MQVKSPFLTVVIPMYNVEPYIEQCLESLLNQSYTDFKVVVVDDGSEDNSAIIAKKYANMYPEMFMYIYQKNAGQGEARNNGMQYANTEYVAFLDSDDWWLPRTAEKLYKALLKEEEQPDTIFMTPVVYSMATKKFSDWADNDRLRKIFNETKVCCPREKNEMYALEASMCRSVWRTGFLKEHNFKFPVGVKWEDVFSHFYLFYWARRCIYVPDCGFVYRVNSGSQTTSLSNESRMDTIKVYANTLAYALENGWTEDEVAYVIDMMMLFLRWGFTETKPKVLKRLVGQAHRLCCAIPQKYVKKYKAVFPESRNLHRTLWLLRQPIGYQVMGNYHLLAIAKAVFHRVVRK